MVIYLLLSLGKGMMAVDHEDCNTRTELNLRVYTTFLFYNLQSLDVHSLRAPVS